MSTVSKRTHWHSCRRHIFLTARTSTYWHPSLGSKKWASEQITDPLAHRSRIWSSGTFFHHHDMQYKLARKFNCSCNQDKNSWTFLWLSSIIFRRKLTLIEEDIEDNVSQCQLPILYMIHSTEFQKRGLPHVHILIKFKHDCLLHLNDIDAIINAEIPLDPEETLI